MGRFPSQKSSGKLPFLKKRGIKRLSGVLGGHDFLKVRKPRVFRNCHRKSPHPTPEAKLAPCRSLHSTMHSYTFPYKEGRVLRNLEGGFGGQEGGGAFYEIPGFPVSKPGVSQSQVNLQCSFSGNVFSEKRHLDREALSRQEMSS